MRRNVPDSPEFRKRQAGAAASKAAEVKVPLKVCSCVITPLFLLLFSCSQVRLSSYYPLITYMPTYISQFVGTSMSDAFVVNTSVLAIYLVLCPFAGKFLNKIGRRRKVGHRLHRFLIFTYPVFSILV